MHSSIIALLLDNIRHCTSSYSTLGTVSIEETAAPIHSDYVLRWSGVEIEAAAPTHGACALMWPGHVVAAPTRIACALMWPLVQQNPTEPGGKGR